MSLPTYPLAPAALGQSVPIELTQVAQANAWALDAPEVRVTFQMSGVGWLVKGPRGFLGVVESETTTRYPDMPRVFRSGLAPETRATLSPSDDGSGRMRVRVDLPAAPFVVPVGHAGEAEVLDQGRAVELDASMTFAAPCQVIARLDVVGDRVVALFHDHLLGGVADPPPGLLEAVRSRKLAGRVFVAGGRAVLDVADDAASRPLPDLRAPEPTVLAPVTRPAEDAEDAVDTVFLSAEEIQLDPAKRVRE